MGTESKITASDVSPICLTLIYTPDHVMLAVYNSGDLIEKLTLQPRFDHIVITASGTSLNMSNQNSFEFNFQLDPISDPTEILDKIYDLKCLFTALSDFVLFYFFSLPSIKILSNQSWRDDWIRRTLKTPGILENKNNETDQTNEISDTKLKEDVERILKEIN